MKRVLIVLAILVVVVGTGFASASQLFIGPSTMQAGAATQLACQGSDPVQIDSYQIWGNYGPGAPYFESLSVKGIHSACNGARLMVRVHDRNGWSQGGDAGAGFVVANGDDNTVYQFDLHDAAYATARVEAESFDGFYMLMEGGTH
jgi:hypothetical protein